METGGPTNPVGIAVTIAAGVAFVVSRFLHVGAGRKEADYLTDPETGAQTHVGVALAQLIDNYNARPETWSPALIDGVIQAIEKIRDDFTVYAQQFSRAGPGAIETIRAVTSQLINDRQREKARILDRATEVSRMPNPVRLFLISANKIDTGIVGIPGVDPMSTGYEFPTLEELYAFARANGERIYQVQSAQEAYDIVNGVLPVPEGSYAPEEGASDGLPWWVWAGIAYGAKVLLFS